MGWKVLETGGWELTDSIIIIGMVLAFGKTILQVRFAVSR